MRTLDEIAIDCGTDKASTHPVKGHNYTPFYDYLLHDYRSRPIKFLEIGVGGGESIRMWLEYFAEAQIHGVDMVKNTNPYNTEDEGPERYTFTHGHQEVPGWWACFLADHGFDWDIIIDDGGHFNDGIIVSHQCLWPVLKPDGWYIVEDFGAGYTPGSVHVKPGFPTHAAWLNGLFDRLHTSSADYDAVFCYPEVVAIHKKAKA